MILLDTNVVSEMFKPSPDGSVREWFNNQREIDLHICSPVLAELHYGLARLPNGRRKTYLSEQINGLDNGLFVGRILPFDTPAAQTYGALLVDCEQQGRPITTMDGMIAAVARSRQMMLATRNTRHFAHVGLALINPFEPE